MGSKNKFIRASVKKVFSGTTVHFFLRKMAAMPRANRSSSLRSDETKPIGAAELPSNTSFPLAYKLSLIFLLPLLLLSTSIGLLHAADLDPTASFYLSPSSGSLSSTFTFDASNSYDQRGFSNTLEYRWNFDYSGGEFGEWSNDEMATHQYTAAGDKTVALEVRDEDGRTDRTYGYLTVYEEAIFDGWFDVSPTSGDTSTEFQFSADISTKASVPQSEYQVRWDFDGDGTFDTDYSSSFTAYHTYSETGYFNSILEVLSPDGDTLTVTGYDDDDPNDVSYVYVTSSGEPQATIDVYPSSGVPSTTFYFDGSHSFDNQDHFDIEYRWDLDGDGTFEIAWGDETNPTYKYAIAGTYTVSLEVRDSDGYTDQVSTTITISGSNLAPEADFSITSDSGLTDKTMGTTGTTFTFNAAGCKDEEDPSSDLQVRWDFEGDGDYDTSFSTTKTAQHQYSDPGTYTVRVEVRDTFGETDTAEGTVTVVSNDAPVATFSVSPLSGTPGTTFDFDASDVSDSQDKTTYLQVRWDFDGDGDYDTSFDTDKTTSHQYDDPGTYIVTMQVKDTDSFTNEAEATITVYDSTAPHAILNVDVQNGTFSTAFHFDGSGSYDGETDSEDLYFRWDTDYTGENDIIYTTSWSHDSTQTVYFDQTGNVTVRLEVKDAEGQISTSSSTVSLHWASEYMDYLKDNGVIRGYENGDLAPDQYVTRAELLKMAMKGADISTSGLSYTVYFSDIAKTDWFYSYVEKASDLGLVEGYADGTFKPNNSINRAEATKIIIETFGADLESYVSGTFPDVSTSQWFANYVGTAFFYGLVNGQADGFFRPDWNMTRGEASKIIALAMQGAL